MKYLLLLLLTLPLNSQVFVERSQANNGAPLIRFSNDTPDALYCYVTYDNGYSYFDFYLDQYSKSRWYYEPRGYYEWSCK